MTTEKIIDITEVQALAQRAGWELRLNSGKTFAFRHPDGRAFEVTTGTPTLRPTKGRPSTYGGVLASNSKIVITLWSAGKFYEMADEGTNLPAEIRKVIGG